MRAQFRESADQYHREGSKQEEDDREFGLLGVAAFRSHGLGFRLFIKKAFLYLFKVVRVFVEFFAEFADRQCADHQTKQNRRNNDAENG